MADLDVARLPYREDLLQALRAEKQRGRKLILVTGCHHILARKISHHLGLFDEVFATSGSVNLVGEAKADFLVQRFGERGFDYVGNSRTDLEVWKHAGQAWVVSPHKSLILAAQRQAPLAKSFEERPKFLKILAKALRVHHWSKNLLIFLPLLLSDSLLEGAAWLACIQAFFAYSFISSSVYILNDLLDIEADRRHPDNRHRPFAAGTLSIPAGLILSPLLVSLGLVIAALQSWSYFAVVLGYFLLTTVYSFRIKQVVMADIICLAVLYTWRIWAGSVVTGIVISEWFLIFSLFFFMSLAFLKRCAELIVMEQNQQKKNSRRAYLVSDLPLLVGVGLSNAYLSVLVLALYIHDPKVAAHMRYPDLLWALCPLQLYWVSRVWLKAYRGVMHTDPLVFALRDKASYLIAVLAGLIWLLARGTLFSAFAF
jgi:4-hydroxybenzoate polyprenyltransferase